MRGRRQGRMGRGVSAAAWLCPPSAPQGSESLSATSPHRAQWSGTETPAWRCRLGDIERLKRLPVEGQTLGSVPQPRGPRKRPAQTHPSDS